jgi:hypothetical protein
MNTCANPTNHRITVTAPGRTKPWGKITVKPGPVAPGRVATVRTPDGRWAVRKIYYYREGGREFVRLERLARGATGETFALGEIKIGGEVVCVVKAGEHCEECDAAQRRERCRRRRAAQRLERDVRRMLCRGVDELDWPEFIDAGGEA